MGKLKLWLNRFLGTFYRQGSPIIRGASFAATTLAFIAAYFLLHRSGGEGVTALSILPAIVGGLAFGVRGGLVSGLFLALLDLLLIFTVSGQDPANLLRSGGVAGLLSVPTIAVVVGLLRNLTGSLDRELNLRQQIEKLLRMSQQNLDSLFESVDDIIIVFDCHGKILNVNRAVERKLQIPAVELEGQPLAMLIPEHNQAIDSVVQQIWEGSLKRQVFTFPSRDGRLIPVETYLSRGTWEGDAAIFAISRDVTEQLKAREAEKEQRNLAEALANTAFALNSSLEFNQIIELILDNVGMVVSHDAANIMLQNGVTTRVIARRGYANFNVDDEVINTDYRLEDLPSLQKMSQEQHPVIIQDTATSPNWRKNRRTQHVRSYIGAPIISRDRVVGFINLESTTPNFYTQVHAERLQSLASQAGLAIEKAELYDEIKKLAITDELTGVLNRRGLFELGQREVDRAVRFKRQLCALILDLDHFKAVNDHFGHSTGDAVLRDLAQRCRENIRDVDILGRYGGEEFVILLLECDLHCAAIVAERLRSAVAKTPFTIGPTRLEITISLGVAQLDPRGNQQVEALIDQADKALYISKETGRNRITISALKEEVL